MAKKMSDDKIYGLTERDLLIKVFTSLEDFKAGFSSYKLENDGRVGIHSEEIIKLREEVSHMKGISATWGGIAALVVSIIIKIM